MTVPALVALRDAQAGRSESFNGAETCRALYRVAPKLTDQVVASAVARAGTIVGGDG